MKKQKRATGVAPKGISPSDASLPKLKLLFTIVPRGKAEIYMTLLEGFRVNMQLSLAAEGTASVEMLEMLGLGDSDKTVIVSVLREDQAEAALQFLDEKFRTIRDGKGIAFTTPLSSVIGVSAYQFLSDHHT